MKYLTILLVASLALLLASCKKNYTCNCTDAQGNVTEVTVLHDTKSSASSTCKARKNPPESCAIK